MEMEIGEIASNQLREFVKRYERLQEEIDALNADRSELMKEVESGGFEKKAFKRVIRRRQSPDDAVQEDLFVDLYERALQSADDHEATALSRAPARETETRGVISLVR